MVSLNPAYRNNRRNFYQEKGPDTVSIGTIIDVFKTKANSNSYDSEYIPTSLPVNGITAYNELTGNAKPENNPEYQYLGYLYCDGSEYNISDYPLLYEQIGNDYGGESSNGITVISGGSNYSSSTGVTFSTPDDPKGKVATGTVTVESGVITSINLTFSGTGYTNTPIITLTNTGGGSGASFEIRIDKFGQIAGINRTNVLNFWPDPYMGTFKVPDLKAKKIVGVGPVYGSGTPTIANIEMAVGAIGGQWYFSKESQKNYFNIGNVRTTGYTDVVGTTNGRITGSQVITVSIVDNDLDGPPVHSHLLYHSEAPQVQGFPGSAASIDTYLTGYRTRTGRIQPFSPTGSIKLTHSHALSKERITDSQVATYDIYNWQGGDTGPGSIKESTGNYYASGNSGTFVTQTFTPSPLNKVFSSGSLIGGREVVTEGTPVYNYVDTFYNTSGTYAYSLDVDVNEIQIFAKGGSASGGVYTTAGNDGGDTIIQLGNGTPLTIIAEGGIKGGAATESSGGPGGAGGNSTVTGTYKDDFAISVQDGGPDLGYAGTSGVSGKLWFVAYPDGAPTDALGQNTWLGRGGLGASDGRYLSVAGTANGSSQTYTYPNSGTWTISPTDVTKYKIVSGTIRIYGARGSNCGNFGGGGGTAPSGCTTGKGGNGKYMELSVLADTNGNVGGVFNFYPGNNGAVTAGGAVTSGTGTGGKGGAGASQSGGGGGGSTFVTVTTTGGAEVIVAGAGGGGGGGGAGEGQCGDDGRPNNITDSVQSVNVGLFSGAGGPGGNYGCTGGGGGGGGGGVGTSGQTGSAGGGNDGAGGNGGEGGGGGGSGGHGGGYGGGRGLSSYRNDYFSLTSSGDSTETDGKIVGFTTEERGYYSSCAGGGGGGGYIVGTITPDTIINSGSSALTITVGSGGAGVSSSINRTVDASINWTESSGTITSDDGSDGEVLIREATIISYQGGSTSISVGDIVVKASDGIEIYATGSGTGDAGGFALPVTQVPTVVIEAQGDQPGSGATATATVTGSVVSGVNLVTGGTGYTSPPIVRFLHGCGTGTVASTQLADPPNNTSVDTIVLSPGSSSAYTRYVKFGGTELERYIIIAAVDCTNVKRFGVKAARGNDKNGGELPDDSADELRVYYNTDGSVNFPASNFLGILVPRPSDEEIASDYDGTGTGSNPTNWYSYFVDLPSGAQTAGVRFKIVQTRNVAAAGNDNGGNTDQYGICDFIYEYKFTNQTVFESSPGEISSDAQTLSYTIEGDGGAQYPAGIEPNDVTFNLTAGTPLVPTAYLDPQTSIPLIEPYALTKHLIKAF